MEKNNLRFIQDQIGYEFDNLNLLEQAFVRKSYSTENGGQNNEILEFIGDKVLDFFVVKMLSTRFGHMTENAEWNEYENEYSEGELTGIKKNLVQKNNLAYRIRMLDLEQFLIMGKSDINQNVQEQDSVQEDLFEAILGAIAIDSKWDMKSLEDAVDIMLNPDEVFEDNENYVELIQEWTLEDHGDVPLFHYEERSYSSSFYIPFDGYVQKLSGLYERNSHQTTSFINASEYKYCCYLKISDEIKPFLGFGKSKNHARKNVCEFAYNYLERNDLLFSIRDEIDNPCKEQAIGQLEILARRGYFEIPDYDFSQEYDQSGNPIWHSVCRIEGEKKTYSAKSSSKKEAKKSAAYKMLNYVLDNY